MKSSNRKRRHKKGRPSKGGARHLIGMAIKDLQKAKKKIHVSA